MSNSRQGKQEIYFTIKMACAYQLNFPEAVTLEDFTSTFTDFEPIFPVALPDFTDPARNFESLLVKRSKLLKKEFLHGMKHSQHEFLQREQGFSKLLEEADKYFFTNNVTCNSVTSLKLKMRVPGSLSGSERNLGWNLAGYSGKTVPQSLT